MQFIPYLKQNLTGNPVFFIAKSGSSSQKFLRETEISNSLESSFFFQIKEYFHYFMYFQPYILTIIIQFVLEKQVFPLLN